MVAVMRDSIGDVMASTCNTIPGQFESDVMEALAARHALSIAIDAGLRCAVLKNDNLKLFYCLAKPRNDFTTFAINVKDILCLVSGCTSIVYSHVKRSGNKVAHHLAKINRMFGELRVWIEEVPHEVHEFVMSDLSSE